MNTGTEIIIDHQITQAEINSSGLNILIGTDKITEIVIGMPGPAGSPGIDGNDGLAGAKGDPGEGLPIGGVLGQVLLKKSGADFDSAWSTNFKIDPSTGNVGIGVDPNSTSRMQIRGISNDTYGGDILNLKTLSGLTALRVFNNGRVDFANTGLQIQPSGGVSFAGLSTSKSGNDIYLNAYNPNNDMTVVLYNSQLPAADLRLADGRLQVEGIADSYFTANLGIGTQSPTTKLDVRGAVRLGSYTISSLPIASTLGAGSIIYVPDEAGGPTIAFSDGTDWRRMSDRAAVS